MSVDSNTSLIENLLHLSQFAYLNSPHHVIVPPMVVAACGVGSMDPCALVSEWLLTFPVNPCQCHSPISSIK